MKVSKYFVEITTHGISIRLNVMELWFWRISTICFWLYIVVKYITNF